MPNADNDKRFQVMLGRLSTKVESLTVRSKQLLKGQSPATLERELEKCRSSISEYLSWTKTYPVNLGRFAAQLTEIESGLQAVHSELHADRRSIWEKARAMASSALHSLSGMIKLGAAFLPDDLKNAVELANQLVIAPVASFLAPQGGTRLLAAGTPKLITSGRAEPYKPDLVNPPARLLQGKKKRTTKKDITQGASTPPDAAVTRPITTAATTKTAASEDIGLRRENSRLKRELEKLKMERLTEENALLKIRNKVLEERVLQLEKHVLTKSKKRL